MSTSNSPVDAATTAKCKILGNYRFFIHLDEYVYVFGPPSNIFPKAVPWNLEECFTADDLSLNLREVTFLGLKAESKTKHLRYSCGGRSGFDYLKVEL